MMKRLAGKQAGWAMKMLLDDDSNCTGIPAWISYLQNHYVKDYVHHLVSDKLKWQIYIKKNGETDFSNVNSLFFLI